MSDKSLEKILLDAVLIFKWNESEGPRLQSGSIGSSSEVQQTVAPYFLFFLC